MRHHGLLHHIEVDVEIGVRGNYAPATRLRANRIDFAWVPLRRPCRGSGPGTLVGMTFDAADPLHHQLRSAAAMRGASAASQRSARRRRSLTPWFHHTRKTGSAAAAARIVMREFFDR